MTAAPLTVAPRQLWADGLKGLLIVLVVLWHVVMKTYLQIDWQLGMPIPGGWGLGADLIWPFLMPLFLLVSGYFAANAYERPWSMVFRSRVLRFLYLYLLWTLIHMAALWAFPDFPTLVPRSLAGFVEAITISPPNTWYLYALAIYFLVAKGLRRVPAWAVIGGAAVLSVIVSAGLVEVVSNRGSLLYNFLFFLVGLHLAPQIRRLVAHSTPTAAVSAVVVYVLAFTAMRITATEEAPGVWLVVSLIGVTMGVLVAPFLVRLPAIGTGLVWLGSRTLAIYVLHMPLLALADFALVGWLSGARVAVQLVAAVVLPVVLTAVIVAASVAIGGLIERDRLYWLFDLPARRSLRRAAPRGRSTPWRFAVVVVVLVATGAVAARASVIPGCPPDAPSRAAAQPGQVSIGGTGDLLLYDVGHEVPADRGKGHFDDVRAWFTQDIVTGNLEQVIADDTGYDKCGTGGECLAFRSDPDAAPAFAGFDLLNLANNHTIDFGREGYLDTRRILAAAGIGSVGARNEISCTRIGDVTVAVLGFAPYGDANRITDLRHARRVIEAAAATADVVVVHAHMGAEGPGADVVRPGTETMYGEDRGDVVAFAHTAIDAGADLILGHGPHVLRGMELYRGRLIAYSLGNFGGGGVFGAEQETRYGAYLEVSLRVDGTLADGRVRSITFEQDGGRPVPDPTGRAAQLIDERGRRDFSGAAPLIDGDGRITPP